MLRALVLFILVVLTVLMLMIWTRYESPKGPNPFGSAAAPVNFIEASKRFFTNYFKFSGRASRSEFWYAMLMYAVVGFLCGWFRVPDTVASTWLLATLIPFFSVSARRLHDTNRSGWLQCVSWVMPVGTIMAIRWLIEPARD